MTPLGTLGLLVTAGAALVAQNLLMARITGMAGSVLVALVVNAAVGLTLLSVLLLARGGMSGLAEATGLLRWWFLIPGLLGSYFVFASITGYRQLGAAPTIAVLVASQLLFGLVWDIARTEALTLRAVVSSALGVALLIGGAVVIVTRPGWH
ncbi:MAG: DMT family transporter [Roseivivax sp.]|nr:DMT family transporter [Roseivivax sp.]